MEEKKYCKNCKKEIKIENYQCYAVYKRIKYCNKECFFEYRHKNKHSLNNLYQRWNAMKNRCYNPNTCYYKNYGARGIKVCDEWLGEDGYNNFKKWALKNGYKKELSLDRIDNNGDYNPNNCRWTTERIQNINKRPSIPNTSGFVGVAKESCSNGYYGYVKINNKVYYTGCSKDIVIAAIMRNNYIIDNNLDNELNDLSQYENEYDMTIRYHKKGDK